MTRPSLALLALTAFLVELALFLGVGVVAHEVADGGLAGAVAAVGAVVVVLAVWGLFIAPKARLRLATVPRAVVSVLLCLGTGWGLVATGHQRWGWVVALAGVVIVAAQVVLPQAEDDAS
ncbi:DUF2568 domain-containing protein [Oryzobacter terrae]|uniref:DUF2568 domain-containing protein n=1 Tax=Oryzobacter terrae TaxID=1620385 RepID=UPI003670798B